MDRDSPIEWTGEAHLVTVTCPACDEGHTVPESTAEHHDGDVLCSDCSDDMEGVDADLFIRGQPRRLDVMSDYLWSRGFKGESIKLSRLADTLRQRRGLIRATEKLLSGDIREENFRSHTEYLNEIHNES